MTPTSWLRGFLGRIAHGAWLLLAGSIVLSGAGRVAAADAQARDFSIQVDGKPAGDYHMTIRRQDDGTTSLSAQSDVKVAVLLVTAYTYSYRGQEVWKDGRLQHFESTGKENGKPFAVTADADEKGLRVKADGKEFVLRPDAWTTSCWHLPDDRLRNQDIALMGCDNGQSSTGRMQYVGQERVQVAGQEQECAHYRLMRDVPYELWYDDQDCLVREEWASNGHRTVLGLVHLGP
ncbi:MAG TPA: DUF6134 family protein [Gemmataceae bacterium]|nr:DUF6134 family protein [Gemmataceae bacterium]